MLASLGAVKWFIKAIPISQPRGIASVARCRAFASDSRYVALVFNLLADGIVFFVAARSVAAAAEEWAQDVDVLPYQVI